MGWLRTMFLGDVGNRLDIQDNEHRIAKMQRQQLQGEREKASKEHRKADKKGKATARAAGTF